MQSPKRHEEGTLENGRPAYDSDEAFVSWTEPTVCAVAGSVTNAAGIENLSVADPQDPEDGNPAQALEKGLQTCGVAKPGSHTPGATTLGPAPKILSPSNRSPGRRSVPEATSPRAGLEGVPNDCKVFTAQSENDRPPATNDGHAWCDWGPAGMLSGDA